MIEFKVIEFKDKDGNLDIREGDVYKNGVNMSALERLTPPYPLYPDTSNNFICESILNLFIEYNKDNVCLIINKEKIIEDLKYLLQYVLKDDKND